MFEARVTCPDLSWKESGYVTCPRNFPKVSQKSSANFLSISRKCSGTFLDDRLSSGRHNSEGYCEMSTDETVAWMVRLSSGQYEVEGYSEDLGGGNTFLIQIHRKAWK